jgi:hypothetical protein
MEKLIKAQEKIIELQEEVARLSKPLLIPRGSDYSNFGKVND